VFCASTWLQNQIQLQTGFQCQAFALNLCVCVCVQTCKGQLHQATIRTRNRLRSRHCSFAKGEQNRMVSWLLQIWPKCLVRVPALSILSWRNILTSHRRRLKRQRMAERGASLLRLSVNHLKLQMAGLQRMSKYSSFLFAPHSLPTSVLVS